MAHDVQLSDAAASAAADAVTFLLDGGTLNIYDGAQPATADTPITTQNLLATVTFGSPAFVGAVNGVATANAITPDSSAGFTATATWFRVRTSGAATVFDGSVDTSGADLNLHTTSFLAGAEVNITSFTYTQPRG